MIKLGLGCVIDKCTKLHFDGIKLPREKCPFIPNVPAIFTKKLEKKKKKVKIIPAIDMKGKVRQG